MQPKVISLGGSLLTKNGEIDYAFLKSFKKMIDGFVKKGEKFLIVVGGGELCRTYQNIARTLGIKDSRKLDWIGIYATRLNASVVKAFMGARTTDDLSYGNMKKLFAERPVLVVGGTKPGGSSDDATVELARKVGSRELFNLSNITYVYDKDPRAFSDAKPQPTLTWPAYFKIVGSKRVPGGNYPFDPVAARHAAHARMKVVIMDGRAVAEVKKALVGKKTHKGTVIQ